MPTISDDLGNWEELGVITVTNSWQIFPLQTSTETFRITTNVANLLDWQERKIKSAAYIRFYYADGSLSPNIYIPVNLDNPVIRDFPIPSQLKVDNSISRSIGCVFSHRRKDYFSLQTFAVWTMKIEALI